MKLNLESSIIDVSWNFCQILYQQTKIIGALFNGAGVVLSAWGNSEFLLPFHGGYYGFYAIVFTKQFLAPLKI